MTAGFLAMLASMATLIYSVWGCRQSRALALRTEAAAQRSEAALERTEAALQRTLAAVASKR